MKDVTILGAGLAGTIMYSVLNKKATIIERNKPSTKTHHAVLHFRNPELGRVLDLEFKKVRVSKGIIYNGQFVDAPSLQLSNLYSQKVLGIIEERSIDDLSEKERWVTSGELSYNHTIQPNASVFFESGITSIRKGVVHTQTERHYTDTIINTLPLPVLLTMLGEDTDIEFKSSPIYVYRAAFEEGFCNVYNTLYFADPRTPVYRATIDKDQIIIESTEECDDEDLAYVVESFGILPRVVLGFTQTIQKHGKIQPILDETRREILNALTAKYNIYSIGRFALWKNVRADDMYQDAMKIKQMMKISEGSAEYLLRKGE